MVISNKFKLFLLVCIFLYQTSVSSKIKEAEDFNPKYLSDYLSAVISYGNQNNEESVKYFNSSTNIALLLANEFFPLKSAIF